MTVNHGWYALLVVKDFNPLRCGTIDTVDVKNKLGRQHHKYVGTGESGGNPFSNDGYTKVKGYSNWTHSTLHQTSQEAVYILDLQGSTYAEWLGRIKFIFWIKSCNTDN